jgi:hypothetical protein
MSDVNLTNNRQNQMSAESNQPTITLGLIERLSKNADPVCTREKAKKKEKILF